MEPSEAHVRQMIAIVQAFETMKGVRGAAGAKPRVAHRRVGGAASLGRPNLGSVRISLLWMDRHGLP
jgi:hypothetical protein